jgi:hypothetical protein
MLTRILCLLVWLGVDLLGASSLSSMGTESVPRPVWFEENSGQAPGEVALVGRGFGVPLVVFKNGALGLGSESGVVRLEPERSSALATVYGEAPTGAVTRSYAPGGLSVSRHYSRIRVSSLWPGADLFYRISGGRLELGLDLVPGQTSFMPSLRWRGAKVNLDSQGLVHVSARGLRFALRAPSAFQPDGATERHAVNVRYQLDRTGRMRFRVRGADPALPLNIDPVFDFSTYIGGAQADSIAAIALGPDGSIYLTGQSASTNLFGISTGIPAGSGKVLITRLAPGGVGVVYAALIGGSNSDQGTGIAVDASGAAYVTGNSNSPNFPTTSGAFQSAAAQDWNAIAVKLDASGALVYSAILGGSGSDWGSAIAVDIAGHAVITGQTISSDYPVTAQAYQKLFGGTQDCFVTMLSADGTSLMFSTLLGGSDLDSCRAIALSPSGTITLGGSTRSSDFPVLGAFQVKPAGFLDGLVVQMNSTGSALLSSSYLGGIGEDQISSLALDSSGNVYVAGTTSTQASFPGTGAGVVTKNGGGSNSFACKISPSLVSLNWCSIIGGSGDDFANAIALLSSGEVLVAGQTTSANLPVVNALQSVFQGSSDGWFAVLNSSGSQWETVSYTGGSATNSVNAAVAFQDRILLAGGTTAQKLPVTTGALQPTSGGNGDGFLQEIAIGNGIVLNGLYPASGNGLVHSLSLVVTDPSGGKTIQTVQVNVSNPFSTSNACFVTFTLASNTLSLTNDAGSAPAGSATVGSNTTLQNSQCSVSASASALSVTGNSVSLHLSLTYKPAFASLGSGATKYVSVSAVDTQGKMLSAPQAATWTLSSQQPPTIVSLSPVSGQGASATFVLTVSDPAGANDLATIQFLVGSSTGLANACAVTYIAQQNQLALSSDSGTGYVGALAPGQASTVSNSQCTLSGAGSSVQLSGKNLVMAVSLQFNTAFAGLGGGATKTTYALPLTASSLGPVGGMTAVGTWTVPQPAPNGPPTVGSITPASGQGAAQSFTLVVSDPLGASDLATVQLLFGTSTAPGNACSVTYIVQQKLFALSNDAGTGYAGTLAPGQATTVANSQCTLSGSGSSVTLSGNTLTMIASLQFSTSFASLGGRATKNVYAEPVNAAGQGPTAGYAQVGTWTVPQTTVTGPVVPVSLAPASGQGMSQAFTLVSSDIAGAADLASVHLIVSGPVVLTNACWITYSAQNQSIGLVNDAASAYVGYVKPGQAASYSNSQCTLSGTGSSVQLSGTLLVLTANLQFSAAFAKIGSGSTKTVYGFPVSAGGKSPAALVPMGTWTIGQPISNPPAVVSVTPSSGQGSSQSFALAVSDPLGASDLATVQLFFNTSKATSGACIVTYTAQQGTLGLTNDAGTGYAGSVTPGKASTVSNSQCTLSGSGSSIQRSGNSLTMTVNLQFASAFASSGGSAVKTIYALPVNAAGQAPSGGLASIGTWTIPQTTPAPPGVGSLTPSSGQGASQSFVLTVSDKAGASDLASVQLHFGSSTALAAACSVTYLVQQNSFSLLNDAGTASAGSVTPGQATSISNSQCALTGSGSSVMASGSTLTLTVNLQFSTAFASLGSGATKNVYAKPLNAAGQGPAGGFVPVGTWTVPQAVGGPPAVVSLSPSTGQGSSASFVLTVSDSGGASSLSTVQLLVGSSTALASSCSITYIARQSTFGLTNDAGTGYGAYVSPGQATSISNSQCTLNGTGSSVQLAGNTLTMTVNLSFSSAFSGAGNGPNKNVYAEPVDAAGQAPASGLTLMGTWTVPQPVIGGPPTTVSLTPASGQGTSQAFTLVVSDSAGATDLSAVHLIVSGPAILTNACWVTYFPQKNSFGLVTDSASAYAGYVTPGQATNVSNSQCTVSGTGSSVQSSGSLLTMTLNLAFKPNFSKVGNGAVKTIFALPVNLAGQSLAALVTMGSWTLP